eukprot:6212693-Pleurochrysis_carterae.AAC.1
MPSQWNNDILGPTRSRDTPVIDSPAPSHSRWHRRSTTWVSPSPGATTSRRLAAHAPQAHAHAHTRTHTPIAATTSRNPPPHPRDHASSSEAAHFDAAADFETSSRRGALAHSHTHPRAALQSIAAHTPSGRARTL